MKIKKHLKMVVAAVTLILVVSCNNEALQEEKVTAKSNTEIVLERVSAMGFDTEGYRIIGEKIIVEGDMAIRLDDILSESSRQYLYDGRKVSANIIANIKLCNDLGSSWDNAFNEAINEYNNVPDTKIRLFSKDYNGRSYTSSNADIKIFYDPDSFVDSPGIWGLGDVTRTNGNPGSEVNINLGNSSVTGLNDERKKKLLMHEIGHCLGLPHQNGTSSVSTTYIQGTPLTGNDKASVMAQYFSYSYPGKFTDGDKKMMQILYPKNADTPYIDVFKDSGLKGINYRLYESCSQLPFNDTLSSIKFYNGAHIWVHEHTNYGGKRYGYMVNTVDYSGNWFNDKASSITFSAWQAVGDLILNKTFSNSGDWNQSSHYHYTTPDKLYASNYALSGKCEAYISGGALKTYISDRGSNPEDIYFKTTDLIFDNRFTYEVSFRARTEASQSRYIKVAVGEGLVINPFEEEDIKITGDMGTYKFTFRPNKYTSIGTLIFYMGDTRWDSWSKDVVLDDIKIVRTR